MSDKQFPYEFEYDEGFFSFRNAEVEVLMDEATFDRYLQAYLESHGLDTRSTDELLVAITTIEQQHKEAETVLMSPNYWRGVTDPQIRVIPRKIPYSMKTDGRKDEEDHASNL